MKIFLDKYLKMWESVSNTQNKNNSGLICNKKYLKAKKLNHKRKLLLFMSL